MLALVLAVALSSTPALRHAISAYDAGDLAEAQVRLGKQGTASGYLAAADRRSFNGRAAGAGDPGYIHNQNATTQTANFVISGGATVGTLGVLNRRVEPRIQGGDPPPRRSNRAPRSNRRLPVPIPRRTRHRSTRARRSDRGRVAGALVATADRRGASAGSLAAVSLAQPSSSRRASNRWKNRTRRRREGSRSWS